MHYQWLGYFLFSKYMCLWMHILIARMRQSSASIYSIFAFMDVRSEKTYSHKQVDENGKFCLSNVTQIFEFLPSYMLKSHSYLSSKIIFNYLPAVILIRSSFNFIKGKVSKPIPDFMTQLLVTYFLNTNTYVLKFTIVWNSGDFYTHL